MAVALTTTAVGAFPGKLGAVGDSLTDEYFEYSALSYATNWTPQLVMFRSVNMGPTAAQAGTTTWGAPRNLGYKYNWALSGATSAGLLAEGQHTGLLAQVRSDGVSNAVLAIGNNDFNPLVTDSYFNIYNGLWSSAQVQAYEAQTLTNIQTALVTVQTAGVFMVMTTIIDPGPTPAVITNFPDAAKRNLVTAVIQTVNIGLRNLAQQYQVPLVDWFGLETAIFGSNTNLRTTLLVGSVAINLRAIDPGPPNAAPTNAFVADGFHPNTTSQGILANTILQAFNSGLGSNVALFSEQEILSHAGIANGGTPTLQAQIGPYSNYVILPVPVTNSWISGSSGKWETAANWSAGTPNIGQSWLFITNANTKTVTIDATTANTPSALTISNLCIAGTAGSTNTLWLNNTGTTTPLQVLGRAVTVDTNGAMVVNHSSVLASSDPNLGLIVGNTGGNASLTIINGGLVVDNSGTLGATASASNNTVLVSGSGSVWSNTGILVVGQGGSANQMIVSNGGALFSNTGTLGNTLGASNTTVVVAGNGAVWNNQGALVVGNASPGNTVTVGPGGTMIAGTLVFGPAGGQGMVVLNGGSVTVNQIVLTNALGVFAINAGTLASSGTAVTNNQVFAVGDGADAATFQLNGGVHSFANGLEIRSNATLNGCGTINGNVIVDSGGTVLANCGGTLTFTGVVTNNGTMQAINGSTLEVYGTVVNNGIIDIINGGTNFHGAFINNGTVLTASSVGIGAITTSGQDITIQIPSVTGHTYQLQYTTLLMPTNWTDTGASQSGNGSVLTFTDPGGATNLPSRFYRVDVTAP
jgi:T5SS/PEP-CTERM-associated repeat protein